MNLCIDASCSFLISGFFIFGAYLTIMLGAQFIFGFSRSVYVSPFFVLLLSSFMFFKFIFGEFIFFDFYVASLILLLLLVTTDRRQKTK